MTRHRIKHGMYGTRIYKIYYCMKQRCNDSKHNSYKYYGARGIKICHTWNSFIKFYKDMNKSYNKHVLIYGKKNTTLDRRFNNWGYSKENCKWSTCKEQANNKNITGRQCNIIYQGKTIYEWSNELGIKYDTLRKRLNRGWSKEDTFTPPI